MSNDFGQCPGVLGCANGVPSCVGDEPAHESCDGADNDCDGDIDPEGAEGCDTFWLDGDGDGFGLDGDTKCLCEASGFYSATQPGYCDDEAPTKFPQGDCTVQCNIFMLSGICPDACGAPAPEAPCPDGFVCLNGTDCRDSCQNDAHCQPGLYCSGGACVSTLADGQACTFDTECLSGYCGDGWCCSGGACCGGSDTHCADGNPCTADTCGGDFTCDYAPADGQCGGASCNGLTWTQASQCVDGQCVAGAMQSCDGGDPCTVYACDPLSGCSSELASVGAVCEPGGCFEYEMVDAKTCDADGGCTQGGGSAICPDGYACKNNQTGCRNNCNNDNHCQPDTYCDGGDCLEKLPHGEDCDKDSWCISGNCQAGTCCEGCCDFGTLGTQSYAEAMELCDYNSFVLEKGNQGGTENCRRIIATFGDFSHEDSGVEGGDTAMVHLSTGNASNTNNQQNGQNLQTSGPDPDGTINGNAFDLCGFEVEIKAPPGAKGFAFDFIFFSSEYPEWVGSQYNDTFNVMMDSQVFDDQNIAFDSNLNAISINVAFFTICDGEGCTEPGSVLQGTGFDDGIGGATGWLTTTVPIIPNETFTLRFVIYDEGDHIYNSEVLINNFRWLEFVSGTGPVTE